MAHAHHDLSNEVTRMKPGGRTLGLGLMVLGIVGILIAFVAGGEDHHRRFWFAYLFGLAGVTCVSCAALIFTIVNHLVRAGWITNVRRILETLALQTGLVLILALPVVFVTLRDGSGSAANAGEHGTFSTIYSWAKPSDTPVIHHGAGHEEAHGEGHGMEAGHHEGDGHDHSHDAAPTTQAAAAVDAHKPSEAAPTVAGELAASHVDAPKNSAAAEDAHAAVSGEAEQIEYPNEQVQPGVTRPFDAIIARKTHSWLNPWFWSVRVIAYFAILFGIAWYYWSNSVKQDATGDIDINAKLSYQAGPFVIACALITTFIAFDMFMALDPHWFSTMYGIYFFASGTQATWAIMALFVLALQSRGYLKQSITTEHRHDLGKFLWAFVFFWGYAGFSQYMLQWYANMPEETFWFDKRGWTNAHPNAYTPLGWALLFGRFVIPFLGLVSRHVKRNKFGLGFWAVWLLCFWALDMYLLVVPEWKYVKSGEMIPFGIPEICAFFGILGLWLGNVIRVLGNHELRPIRDARVHESLALQNF